MAKHHLEPSVETCHWGYFDATQKPVLKVKSGDIVTIDTVTGNPDVLPDASKFHIPAALPSILAELKPLGPHILTGPVYVEGAKPGNVLEVKIHGVSLLQDWGFNVILPLLGTLPHDYDEPRKVNIPLDKARNVGILPWGLELELKPFFGVMGVAPPKGWGRITSVMPQSTGGNLDNKELTAGATLYLPVFAEGALFSCGDGHGAQGDGEVCITAIETALRGVFEFVVRDDLTFKYPRAETDTHYITDGHGSRPRPMRHHGASRHDRASEREGGIVASRRLHAVQPRRRPSRDPDRQWLQGRPYDDAQEARRRLRSRA
jgi:acetamidase/formamidase